MTNQTFNGDAHDAQPSHDQQPTLDEQIPDFLRRLVPELTSTSANPAQPQLLSAIPIGIPTELRDIPQWVPWRGEWKAPQNGKPGKWNKVPFQANGRHARVDDPATWTDFPTALRAYLDSNQTEQGIKPFSGLGFVLTRENGVVGVDLDNVIDPVTGHINPQAIAVIELLGGYTEISPSGTGIRILVYGKLPPKGRTRNQSDGTKYEVYDAGRFLTITGRKLPGLPSSIEDRSAQLREFHANYIAAPEHDSNENGAKENGVTENASASPVRPIVANALSDDELLQKARESRKGALFAALWAGDLAHPDLASYNQDHSVADLALCNPLAFWTGRDPDRIDRLFRQSGLMREKWDKRHSSDGRTYGQMTIERAIDRCERCFSEWKPGTFGEVVFPQLTAADIPPASETAGRDRIYGEGQLRKLLYPHLNVETLTSEAAHAARLMQAFDGNLRYSPKLGWIHFNGRFWEQDEVKSSRTLAEVATLSRVVRAEIARLYELGATLARAGRQSDAAAMTLAAKRHTSHLKHTETKKFIHDSLQLAAGKLHIGIEMFNVRPFFLGFQNLIWDRGVRRLHRREDYLLVLSPVEIQPDAADDDAIEHADGQTNSEQGKCDILEDEATGAEATSVDTIDAISHTENAAPSASTSDESPEKSDWAMVLSRISGGDADLERTIQDVVGYLVSGKANLRLILWFYGSGGTGKSTIAELIETMMGSGTYAVSPGKLQGNADRERLGAALWNCRLAICSEAASQKLDSDVLKMLSGGDTMPARFLFKEVFTIRPTHVLVMISNFAPRVDAYDDALKDRVLVLPFVNDLGQGGMLKLGGNGNTRIESARKDADSSLVRGFTEWALAGAQRVLHTQDIYRCELVKKASAKFWEDTDALGEFWEMMPLKLAGDGISKSELRNLYEQWCNSENINAYSRPVWNRACESVGLKEVRQGKTNTRCWVMPTPRVQQLLAESKEEVDGRVASRILNIYGRKLTMNKVIYGTFAVMARQEGWEDPMKVSATVEEQMREWFGL